VNDAKPLHTTQRDSGREKAPLNWIVITLLSHIIGFPALGGKLLRKREISLFPRALALFEKNNIIRKKYSFKCGLSGCGA